jgi:hypothetical protein
MAEAPARDRRLRLAIGVAIAAGAAVRLAATRNDLWLDEIWTLTLLDGLRSPLGIVTELRHDNNHILNSLAMWALRPLGSDWVYRLPAWLAGTATIALGARLAWLGDGPAAKTPARDAAPLVRALVAAVVFAASYPLVQYASEARGYALAIAFGLAAVVIAVGADVRPASRAAPLAWAALVLALLGHALALHLLVALVAWSAVRVWRRGDPPATAVATLAWWWAVPVAALAALYLGFLRGITVGGGNREGLVPPLLRAIAMTTGLPFDAPPPMLVVVGLAVFAGGVAWLVARGSDQWVLYVVGAVASPVLLAVLQPTNLWAERYFLVSAVLWLVLVARLLAAATVLGPGPRIAAALAGALFVAANGSHVAWLLRDGRGAYVDALRWVDQHTTDAAATIESDHDFRNRLVVQYFAGRIGATKPIRYVQQSEIGVPGPQWYIAHRGADDRPPASTITDRRGNRYHFEKEYPTAPLSGLRWFVFRRVDGPS